MCLDVLMNCGLDSRSHLDASGDLRFSLGSLAETQSDHYRSTKVIRRPRRGRVGLRRDEQKVGAFNTLFLELCAEHNFFLLLLHLPTG